MTRLKKAWQSAEGRALATELHQVLEVSHRQAKGIIDAGCVKVNGEAVHTYGLRLKAEDRVAVDYDPDTVYQTLPAPRKQLDKAGFKILWEDKHLLFVDKPAGLLTVPPALPRSPSRRTRRGTRGPTRPACPVTWRGRTGASTPA